MGARRTCPTRSNCFVPILPAQSCLSLVICQLSNTRSFLQVIKRHADLGYMAVAVYPLATDFLQNVRVPGGIKAEDWDGFHDLIVIHEIARCGYLGVIWALTCGNSIGAPPLIRYGTDEQKRRFVPSIMDGSSRFCLGVTEPDGAL